MEFLKCAAYIAGIGILWFFIGRILPKSWFHYDRFPYRECSFEQGGKIYEKIGIKAWKDVVPDMSKLFPKLIPAKSKANFRPDMIERMIQETCVAEFTHVILSVLSLYCLKIWPSAGGIILTVLVIVFGNLIFIFIQRYNRPRLVRLKEMYDRRNADRRSA